MQGKRNSAKMAVTDIVKCVFLLQMFISRIGERNFIIVFACSPRDLAIFTEAIG